MARHHPHPYPPPCYGGEALAVVAEALALERETIAETARLVGFLDGGVCGRGEPAEELLRLQEAASRVAEISWALQDPAWTNPYAGLGSEVMKLALQILDLIRAAETPPKGDGPKAEA